MKYTRPFAFALLLCAPLGLSGCGRGNRDQAQEAPPPAQVQHEQDGTVVQVDHPEQFPLFAATTISTRSQLVVTGVVGPDVARNVPVISLASGRVVDIRARLGDTVQKGQLLLSVRSDDVSGAFSDYRKALADEALASTQLERSKLLFTHGAISKNDLDVAQDTEQKARVDVETSAEHLRLLGNDPDKPQGVVNIYAPASGVITDQEVTNAAGVQALGTSPFTISDLSDVWVVCDVHEDDLPTVRVGDSAEIRLAAYPNQKLEGQISNIGAILDPSIRTAKVRIQVHNPGIIRLGMFVTATFTGRTLETHTAVPSTAILHLRDRDWAFVPAGNNQFRRVGLTAGPALLNNMQQIDAGINPGTRVVQNALELENTVDQ